MQIDAYHYLWRYDAAFGWIDPASAIARDFSTAVLDAALTASGHDGAIVVQARKCAEETDFLFDAVAQLYRIGGMERYLDHIFTQFWPDRLIWGSDWPVCLLATPYSAVHDLIAEYIARHCSAAEVSMFGGNAARAYVLEPRMS